MHNNYYNIKKTIHLYRHVQIKLSVGGTCTFLLPYSYPLWCTPVWPIFALASFSMKISSVMLSSRLATCVIIWYIFRFVLRCQFWVISVTRMSLSLWVLSSIPFASSWSGPLGAASSRLLRNIARWTPGSAPWLCRTLPTRYITVTIHVMYIHLCNNILSFFFKYSI